MESKKFQNYPHLEDIERENVNAAFATNVNKFKNDFRSAFINDPHLNLNYDTRKVRDMFLEVVDEMFTKLYADKDKLEMVRDFPEQLLLKLGQVVNEDNANLLPYGISNISKIALDDLGEDLEALCRERLIYLGVNSENGVAVKNFSKLNNKKLNEHLANLENLTKQLFIRNYPETREMEMEMRKIGSEFKNELKQKRVETSKLLTKTLKKLDKLVFEEDGMAYKRNVNTEIAKKIDYIFFLMLEDFSKTESGTLNS